MQMCNLIHKGLIKSHTGLTPDCSYGWWMDQRVELKSQPIHIDCCAKLATQINCCTRWRALHNLFAIPPLRVLMTQERLCLLHHMEHYSVRIQAPESVIVVDGWPGTRLPATARARRRPNGRR